MKTTLIVLGITAFVSLTQVVTNATTFFKDDFPTSNEDDGVFSCREKRPGEFYADVPRGCKIFHACVLNEEGQTLDVPLECVNGTLFDEQIGQCWNEDEVKCDESSYFAEMDDENENKLKNTRQKRDTDEEEELEDKPKTIKMEAKKPVAKIQKMSKFGPDFLPTTSFTCRDKVMGTYYADNEAGCQLFHICAFGLGNIVLDFRFLCLNNTLFNPKSRACEDYRNVVCNMKDLPKNIVENIEPTTTSIDEESDVTTGTSTDLLLEDDDDDEEIENAHNKEELSDETTTELPQPQRKRQGSRNRSRSQKGRKQTSSENVKEKRKKDMDYEDDYEDKGEATEFRPLSVQPMLHVVNEGIRNKRQALTPQIGSAISPSQTQILTEGILQPVPAGSEFIELWIHQSPVYVHGWRFREKRQVSRKNSNTRSTETEEDYDVSRPEDVYDFQDSQRENQPITIHNLPVTSFSCSGKITGGYYADMETGCQMFHVCAQGGRGEAFDFKFLCTNGTVFSQKSQTCDEPINIDCTQSPLYYPKNPEILVDIPVPHAELGRIRSTAATKVRGKRAVSDTAFVKIYENNEDAETLAETFFSCKGKIIGGYYADVENDCRTFHVCSRGEAGQLTDFIFRCANSTSFNQSTRTCDENDEVDCEMATSLYNLDDDFSQNR